MHPALTLGAVTVFAAAFGGVEAAVVVYLRELIYPEGFDFPLRLLPPDLAIVELIREAATLVMLAAVGVAAASTAWGRFGLFALAFGVWDLVYYIGLYAALGWPSSLAAWDVLFLIPGIWTGPVWTVALIALLLVVFGVLLYLRGEAGRIAPPRRRHWAAALLSLALLLGAFLANHSLVLAEEVPTDFPEAAYFAGLLVGLTAAVDLLWRQSATATAD